MSYLDLNLDNRELTDSIKNARPKFKTKNGDEIIVVQIAGLVARRIICECSKSQTLQQGERIGMIRFGSRVDIYFNNYKNLVKQNQTAVAGETLIAKK